MHSYYKAHWAENKKPQLMKVILIILKYASNQKNNKNKMLEKLFPAL